MADSRELGPLTHIAAEAIGQPGQRRFRLQAISAGGDSVSLWLEKEQLAATGEAIESVLRHENYQYERVPLDDIQHPPAFPLSADIEMQVGRLSMGVNRNSRGIVLVCAEAANPDESGETVSMEFDFRRGHELRRQIGEVVAAGRPPCPLCGEPLDPEGHVCPRSNGHHAR